jgi:tRNA(Ile)-lysidine synthase
MKTKVPLDVPCRDNPVGGVFRGTFEDLRDSLVSRALSLDDFSARLNRLGLAGGASFALAVSGGPDSMALAALGALWARTNGHSELSVLVVDHGLRPESSREAEDVIERLRALGGLSPHLLRLDLGAPRTAVMEKARAGRYVLLARHCAERNIPFLLLAHHLDDQAETVLMRLAKGSGLDGLCAMRAVQRYDGRLSLLRPFLDVPKAALLETCAAFGVSYVLDPSNRNETYLRPRLRDLMCGLEREGLTSARLGVVAGRLARAREALEEMARTALSKTLRPSPETLVCLDRDELLQWPAEIRLRVIVQGLARLEPDFSPARIRLERLEAIVEGLFSDGPFARRTLGGFLFSRRGGCVVVEREEG